MMCVLDYEDDDDVVVDIGAGVIIDVGSVGDGRAPHGLLFSWHYRGDGMLAESRSFLLLLSLLLLCCCRCCCHCCFRCCSQPLSFGCVASLVLLGPETMMMVGVLL